MHSLKVLGGWTFALLGSLALGAAPARASDAAALIAPTAGAETARLVTVIAADIDADGDLDVVASDRALQLHVWVNDGQGHFTKREPSRSTAWQVVPPDPVFDGGPAAPQSATQLDPQTFDAGPRTAARRAAAAAAGVRAPAARLQAADRLVLASRAPPRTGIAGR